jgi:hypothetical protein
MTDRERARAVAALIVEALRLTDTHRLATVHYLLGLVAIEAARKVCSPSYHPDLPPGVIPLRRPERKWSSRR